MASSVRYDDVEVGTELPTLEVTLQRRDLIRYAGASGDFNPIHWNQQTAVAVGLPDVIAHGMLTMATAGRVVTDWVGDPGAVLEYSVRFSNMVPVPDDDRGATLTLSGRVADKLDGTRVRVDITASLGETEVLKAARAVVQLA